ncbi:hypothetical protein [Massilia timonae]|uniref:hypothetical protein n=1 Tax=Massilia timonae TaxID=47229 RepID=UPI0028A047EC|nr:hypothetical protein [Massilia timonae]
MSFTFKLLRRGDEDILRFYKKAYELWAQLLSDYSGNSEALARELSLKQMRFEWIVKDSDGYDRWDGQEIMVLSGLAYYLEDGTEEGFHLAKSVAEAFEMSYCSLEVKGLAKRASKLFYLES